MMPQPKFTPFPYTTLFRSSTFSSAAELTAWVGTCPGKEESAEQNQSSRSAKGNKYLRRVLNQAAHAAVDRKSTRLNSSHRCISYAVFCWKENSQYYILSSC